jgi:hypothetical protein
MLLGAAGLVSPTRMAESTFVAWAISSALANESTDTFLPPS